VPIIYNPITDRKFFYIHIPRTAGRFLVENFIAHGCKIIHPFTNKIITNLKQANEIVEGVEMLHAHEFIYNRWISVKDLPHFTIIRDPIDRFFSASCCPDKELNEQEIEDWDVFNKQISKPYYRNWFRPQHEFISSKTKVWKYEDGFGEDFCNWISDIVSFPFSIKTDLFTPIKLSKNKLKKTDALLKNIKKYYEKDFKNTQKEW